MSQQEKTKDKDNTIGYNISVRQANSYMQRLYNIICAMDYGERQTTDQKQ